MTGDENINMNKRNLLIWLSLLVFALLYDYFTGSPLMMGLLLLLLVVLLVLGLIFPKFEFLSVFDWKNSRF